MPPFLTVPSPSTRPPPLSAPCSPPPPSQVRMFPEMGGPQVEAGLVLRSEWVLTWLHSMVPHFREFQVWMGVPVGGGRSTRCGGVWRAGGSSRRGGEGGEGGGEGPTGLSCDELRLLPLPGPACLALPAWPNLTL